MAWQLVKHRDNLQQSASHVFCVFLTLRVCACVRVFPHVLSTSPFNGFLFQLVLWVYSITERISFNPCRSRGSSVGIASGYGLDDRGSGVRLSAGAGDFSLHHRVQTGFVAPLSLLFNGYQGLLPWG